MCIFIVKKQYHHFAEHLHLYRSLEESYAGLEEDEVEKTKTELYYWVN